MIDTEVERLRRLRACALRVRAIARALGGKKYALDDALLTRGGCAAWRIARAVSGRLRAHPYAPFQKDAGFSILAANSVVATAIALGASNRSQALTAFEQELKCLSRDLDDARALTWAPELSDSFGRSQLEIRSLTVALECETRHERLAGGAQRAQPTYEAAEAQRKPIRAKKGAVGTAPAETDWPYLAF